MALALFGLGAASLPAQGALQDCVSREQFSALSEEMAPKVNLFAEVWRQDPEAEFYGGTSRDFLYWLKGKFQDCRTPGQRTQIERELRAAKTFDVREFIMGDSDVDVASQKLVSLNADRFGIRKVDTISPDVLLPETESGRNELLQGYIPAEKIRLGKSGIHAPAALGDGVGEIYSGKLTVHFTAPEVFAKGKYAAQGLNHPVLLALRYQRVLAMNYFREHGPGRPAPEFLRGIDPASEKAVKQVVQEALKDGSLKPYLEKSLFQKWMNGTLQKAFRSYTNPTAAKLVMEHFGSDRFSAVYPQVESTNQYIFRQFRDEKKMAAAIAKLGTTPAALFESPAKVFPDGYLYHGTRDEKAFRGILLQGFLPSEHGTAGRGLYGVSSPNKSFAEDWGGTAERLIRIPVSPDARIVDVTSGPGKAAYRASGARDLDEFAESIGADIVRYPYETEAFVVKNSTPLGKPEGVNRSVMTLGEALEKAKAISSAEDVVNFGKSLSLNNFSKPEMLDVFQSIRPTWVEHLPDWKTQPQAALDLLGEISAFRGPWRGQLQPVLEQKSDFLRGALDQVKTEKDFERLEKIWNFDTKLEPETSRMLERLTALGVAKPYQGPFRNLEDMVFKLGDSRQSPLRSQLIDRFRPAATEAIAKQFHSPDQILELRRIAEGERDFSRAFPKESIQNLIEQWRKQGHLDFLVKNITGEADLKKRLLYLANESRPDSRRYSIHHDVVNSDPVSQALFHETWPALHQQAVLEYAKAPRTYFEGAPETWGKAQWNHILLGILAGNSPPEEAFSAWRDTELSLFYGASPWPGFTQFLKETTSAQDPSLMALALQTKPKDEDFAGFYFTQLEKGDPQVLEWARKPENLKFLFSLLPKYSLSFQHKAWPKFLEALAEEHSREYAQAAAEFFGTLPSHWYEKNCENCENHYAAYTAIFPKDNAGGFYNHPRAAEWIDNLLNHLAFFGIPEIDSQTAKVIQILQIPAVVKSPQATQLFEAALGARGLGPQYKKFDQELLSLLAQGPWSNHPRREAWEKSVGIARAAELETFIGVFDRLPRKASLQKGTVLGLFPKKYGHKWRPSLPAETTGNACADGFAGLGP